MPRVECPKCGDWLDVRTADYERTVECRACGAVFPALEIEGVEDALDRRDEREKVQDLLRGPARALLILSIVSMVVSCISGAIILSFGLSKFRIFGSNGDAEQLMLVGVITAVAGTLYYVPVLVGAVMMHEPQNRFWPIFGALLGIAAVVFCWTIPVLNLVNCGFGVWALGRLYRSEVLALVRGEADAPR